MTGPQALRRGPSSRETSRREVDRFPRPLAQPRQSTDHGLFVLSTRLSLVRGVPNRVRAARLAQQGHLLTGAKGESSKYGRARSGKGEFSGEGQIEESFVCAATRHLILDSPIFDELGRTSLLKPPLFLVFVIKIVDTSKFPAAEGVVQREIETLLVVSTRNFLSP